MSSGGDDGGGGGWCVGGLRPKEKERLLEKKGCNPV